MNEAKTPNPFDLLLDQIREVVRAELRAANGNGNGHAASLAEADKEKKEKQERLNILAAAKGAVEAGGLLTAEQLAVMLQVHKATIYERVKKKTIPYCQAGRFVRFNLSEVLESERKKIENSSCKDKRNDYSRCAYGS